MLFENRGARRRVRSRSGRSTDVARDARRAARHAMELVERRVMLTVNLNGTSGNDTITISATAAATTVTINGTPTVVPVTPTETITINAGDGDDAITVEGTTIPVTVNGQNDNDRITLSSIAMNLDGIERQVTFNGGAQDDAAVLNDRTNEFPDEFTVEMDLIFRGFFGGLGYGGDTESVTLNNGLGAGMQPSAGSAARGAADGAAGADGDNVINVEALPQGTSLILNTGGGDDQINLGPSGMLLDPIEGPVTANGEGGTDALQLFDQNNAFPDVWEISAESAARPNFGGVSYETVESLRLDAGLFSTTQPATRPAARAGTAVAEGGPEGGGDNVFNIASLSVPTTINGGAGNDDFFVGQGGTLAPLAGVPLALNGQAGIDQLFVDDSMNAADDAYGLSTTSVARNAANVVTYGTMERLRLDLGDGDNPVDVNATATTVTIFGGGGNDVVQLGAGDLGVIDGRVTVNGEAGDDAIFLNDQTPATARDYVVSDRDVSVTGLLETMLTYLDVVALTLRATGGANNVTVEETAPATPLTLVSGAGDDVVIVNDDDAGSAEVVFVGAEELTALTVRNGGRARIAPGGSNVLRLGALTTVGTGALDITNNAAIIDYAGASPLLDVRAQVTSGYAGGAWTGGGIASSSAAANPGRAVGYAEAAALFSTFPATFAGQSVDNTSVLLRYTRYGDANLDQQVNLQDFNRLAANFGLIGNALWTQGDFDYNGSVNLQDFNRLAASFGQGV